MSLFEGYSRRIDRVNDYLNANGISKIEDAYDICLKKGFRPSKDCS